ncbi:MAG: glycerophosphodiester phosphodiesterase family protein [Parvibaculaceae bacterium]|jgi:glycerophosphoryl diester phosphodiesterase
MRWSPELRRLDWLVARPIAHRGLHNVKAGIVENCESAFAAAIAGNYAIECDLQLSGDGEAVVFHDGTLDRLTDMKGSVGQRSVRELKRVGFKSGKDSIQTFSELLEQVDGNVPLVVEIKTQWDGNPQLVDRATDLVRPYKGHLAFMSFDPKAIARLRQMKDPRPAGIVADRTTPAWYPELTPRERLSMRAFLHARETRPDFISYYWRDFPYPPVNRFRAAGHPVICWTIKSREAQRRALRYCDQITFEDFAA